MIIVLDTFPASSTGKLPTKAVSLLDHCKQWIDDCEFAGHTILVPAISYYEVLRELEQVQSISQIAALKSYCLAPERFIALTTEDLELAAQLWGRARRGGRPTADPHALDGDVILAAQVINSGLSESNLIVASTNPKHISLFVPCDLWTNIKP